MLLVPSKKLDLDVKTWQLPERLCRLIVSHSSKDNPSPPSSNDTDIQTQLHTVQHLDVHKNGKGNGCFGNHNFKKKTTIVVNLMTKRS